MFTVYVLPSYAIRVGGNVSTSGKLYSVGRYRQAPNGSSAPLLVCRHIVCACQSDHVRTPLYACVCRYVMNELSPSRTKLAGGLTKSPPHGALTSTHDRLARRLNSYCWRDSSKRSRAHRFPSRHYAPPGTRSSSTERICREHRTHGAHRTPPRCALEIMAPGEDTDSRFLTRQRCQPQLLPGICAAAEEQKNIGTKSSYPRTWARLPWQPHAGMCAVPAGRGAGRAVTTHT